MPGCARRRTLGRMELLTALAEHAAASGMPKPGRRQQVPARATVPARERLRRTSGGHWCWSSSTRRDVLLRLLLGYYEDRAELRGLRRSNAGADLKAYQFEDSARLSRLVYEDDEDLHGPIRPRSICLRRTEARALVPCS